MLRTRLNMPESLFMCTKLAFLVTSAVKATGLCLWRKLRQLENGITTIELDYWVNNEGAKRFYEKQDYAVYREFVYKNI